MPESTRTLVTTVPDYRIEDGIMHITAGEWSMCMALRTFEQGMARASRVIAEHYAKRAEVIPMRRRSKG